MMMKMTVIGLRITLNDISLLLHPSAGAELSSGRDYRRAFGLTSFWTNYSIPFRHLRLWMFSLDRYFDVLSQRLFSEQISEYHKFGRF